MKKHPVIAAFAAFTSVATSLLAGPSPAPVPVSAPAPESAWEFRLGLPLWVSGIVSGDAGARGVSAPVEISAADVISKIDMAAALSLEVRHGRWAVVADGLYVRLSDSVSPRGRLIDSASLEITQALAEAALSYRIVDDETWKLDAFAGARYNHVGLKFDLNFSPKFIRDRHVDASKDWVDPFIGTQLRAKVCRPVTVVLKGDVGGFGVASDLTWQAYGGVEFQVSRNIWTSLGWRHLHTDYQDGKFNYDVSTTGPLLEMGANF